MRQFFILVVISILVVLGIRFVQQNIEKKQVVFAPIGEPIISDTTADQPLKSILDTDDGRLVRADDTTQKEMLDTNPSAEVGPLVAPATGVNAGRTVGQVSRFYNTENSVYTLDVRLETGVAEENANNIAVWLTRIEPRSNTLHYLRLGTIESPTPLVAPQFTYQSLNDLSEYRRVLISSVPLESNTTMIGSPIAEALFDTDQDKAL